MVGVATFPDHVSAAALSIAIAAGGAIQLKTTLLVSMDEGLEATKKAGQVGYRPPGS